MLDVTSKSKCNLASGAQLAGYFHIPGVRHYLIVLADQRLITQHSRREDESIPTRIIHDGVMGLAPPGITAAGLFDQRWIGQPALLGFSLAPYLAPMSATPAFLDTNRPDVPDIVVPRGITPFHLPDRPVRGRLVRLGALAQALLGRHENAPEVTRLAGEALALSAGLSSALKYRGSFSMQAKGDGPVSMLLADCTQEGALRGYARADAEKLAELLAGGQAPTAAQLLGKGYLAFTVDQGGDMDRYQGIVDIEGPRLSDMALHYFRTSEQLQYDVHLAAGLTPDGWRAAALILERVAGDGGIDPDLDTAAQDEAWRTAKTLAATLTEAELLDDSLLPDRLIWRLFGAEGVAIDRPRALAYGCRCSRAKLSGILQSFPDEDLDEMAVGGDIVMTCEFCKYDFRFARLDVRGRVGDEGK